MRLVTTNQIMIRYGNTPCVPYTPTQSAHSGTCTIRAIFNPAKHSLATSERLVFDIKTSILYILTFAALRPSHLAKQLGEIHFHL